MKKGRLPAEHDSEYSEPAKEGRAGQEPLDPSRPIDAAGEGETAAGATAEPVDYKDRWLRAEADLQNFRRRAQRDVEEATRSAEERPLLDLLSLLDDLERALESAREGAAPEGWVQGVQLVANRMRDTLARYRVTPIESVGKPFDPEQHEALLEVDPAAGVAPGTVVQEVRRAGIR